MDKEGANTWKNEGYLKKFILKKQDKKYMQRD